MMKYAIRFWPYTTLDYRAAEKYLEEKAQKGLSLAGLDVNSMPIVWYKKTEPINVKYCIDGFKHTDYIEKDEEQYNAYLDMAKKSGWNHVCEINYMQYFVSAPNTNPVPLHTAPETEFEAIKRPYKKAEMPITLMWLFVLFFLNCITDGEIIEKAIHGFSLLTPILIGVIILLVGFIRYIFFIIRGSRAIVERKIDFDTSYNKYNFVKVWGSFYNLVLLFQYGMLPFLFIYMIAFKEYKKTGDVIALYCGISLFISMILMKVTSTAESVDKERQSLWNKIGIFALGVFIITMVLTWIFIM